MSAGATSARIPCDWWHTQEADPRAWDRLLARKRKAFRRRHPSAVPSQREYSAINDRFVATLSIDQRDDYITLGRWDTTETSLYAEAGFELGLMVGRRGAR